MPKAIVKIGGFGVNLSKIKPGIEFGSLFIDKPEQIYRFGKFGKSDDSIVQAEFLYTDPFEISESIFDRAGSLDKWLCEFSFTEAASPFGADAKLTMSFSAGQMQLKVSTVVVKAYGYSSDAIKFSGLLNYVGTQNDTNKKDSDDERYSLSTLFG
ncbi:MAG: hypothetical protein ACOYL3_19910 [Desulfuromonadaceae bacterium]